MKKYKIIILIIIAFIAFTATPFYCGEILDENKTVNVDIEKVLELTNKDRQENGKKKLIVNGDLVLSAKAKASDMVVNNYFDHNSPEGITPWHWFEKYDYIYSNAGENLAIDYLYTEDMQEGFMNSKGHRENILNDSFTEIGIAKFNNYTVIHFGSR